MAENENDKPLKPGRLRRRDNRKWARRIRKWQADATADAHTRLAEAARPAPTEAELRRDAAIAQIKRQQVLYLDGLPEDE